jgi:hypothetical protein
MLNVNEIPTFLFVIRGNKTAFIINETISVEKLMDFVHGLYPKNEVPLLTSEAELIAFLMKEGSKAVLFSKYNYVTHVEFEISSRFREFLSFAHVHVSEKSHWAFKSFNDLSMKTLPNLFLQHKNENHWFDSLNRKVIQFLSGIIFSRDCWKYFRCMEWKRFRF